MSIAQDDKTQNAPPAPDPLAQAGDMLRRYRNGEPVAHALYPERGATVVTTSALLAIAAGLRDIQNTLHEINQKLPESEIAALLAALPTGSGKSHAAAVLGDLYPELDHD
jgi:hypothetical protein